MSRVEARDILAIHPFAASLVDWSRVVAPQQRWTLVTRSSSRDDLLAAGRDRGLHEVVALDDWCDDTVREVVSKLIRGGLELGSTRLVTMIEPVMLVVAALRAQHGIPGDGPDVVLPFVDKVEMKRAMRGAEPFLPPWIAHDPVAFAAAPEEWLDRVIATVGLPAFAKPRAENSAAGTALLSTRSALRDFLQRTRRPVEIDAYIDADVFHLDSVVWQGSVRWFGAGRYLHPPAQALHGAPLAGMTVARDSPQFEALRDLNQVILACFPRIPDGCVHLEMLRRRADGRWFFLEIAARCPGWRVPEIHQLHQGVDLRVAHYRCVAGLEPDLVIRPGPHAAYYAPLKTRPGRITAVHEPDFASAHRWEWFDAWRARSDVVRAATMNDFLGACVLWNEDPRVLEADLAQLDRHRPYDVADDMRVL